MSKKAKPKTIAEYIAAAPKEAQEKLRQMRTCIRSAAPGAKEGLKWGVPAFSVEIKVPGSGSRFDFARTANPFARFRFCFGGYRRYGLLRRRIPGSRFGSPGYPTSQRLRNKRSSAPKIDRNLLFDAPRFSPQASDALESDGHTALKTHARDPRTNRWRRSEVFECDPVEDCIVVMNGGALCNLLLQVQQNVAAGSSALLLKKGRSFIQRRTAPKRIWADPTDN
jgi:hypothetical protein